LQGERADVHDVFESALRALSVLLSMFLLAGFGLFAIDSTRTASAQTKAQIEGMSASRSATPAATGERAHTGIRGVVDDVNDVALAPFIPLTEDSSTAWVRRGIPAALGLIVYGFGLAMLARFNRGHT
jgi:hypothetical protein